MKRNHTFSRALNVDTRGLFFPSQESTDARRALRHWQSREEGNYLIELAVLGPLSLVFYWCVAEILTSHGFDRDVSQWLGISAGFLVGLPLYGALRPYIVSVVHDESGPKEEPRDREKEGLRRE